MKKQSSVFLLLLVLITACRNDSSIGPSDLLYKRWHLLQTRGVNDTTWVMYDTDAYYTIEYHPEGSLVYQRNGITTSAPCCSGSRFERTGVILKYSEFSSCPNVKCAPNPGATITILKDNLLELQTGDRVSQYTPAQ
ncbi:hypothetical protein SAMN05216167_11679 [Spirosoma endophyticum]|uniref:Lipocalin-like domain-containing protein n=1 Tax=Spirosoma endophyticum TaxID=662367 RepID=A0A1I2C1U1_9BACT|nr:hypothetical protein SAMN05216167_11679 [Spirosoma endophyticum]